tara:strand:- start:62 stop:526 length:465 start_codon:yes stop_codon:yes gene_type:complete
MRYETNYIVIHCSATRPSQDIGVKEIDRWHRERGFIKVGYGTVIRRNGEIERGRDDDDVQAHCKGYNSVSTSVCLVGGSKEDNYKEPEDNFTAEQWESLIKELDRLAVKYPSAKIIGHYHLSDIKSCPNFDVDEFLMNEDIPNYDYDRHHKQDE